MQKRPTMEWFRMPASLTPFSLSPFLWFCSLSSRPPPTLPQLFSPPPFLDAPSVTCLTSLSRLSSIPLLHRLLELVFSTINTSSLSALTRSHRMAAAVVVYRCIGRTAQQPEKRKDRGVREDLGLKSRWNVIAAADSIWFRVGNTQ